MRKIGQIFRFLIPVIALVALVVFLVGAGRRERAERAKKVRGIALIYEAWNTGNVALLDEVHSPDLVRHGPGSPWGEEDFKSNKERLLKMLKDYPGFKLTMDFLLVDGDRTADRYTFRMPLGNGKEVVSSGVCHHRWVDGKVVEVWEYDDLVGLYQQLGFKLVPSEKQAGK